MKKYWAIVWEFISSAFKKLLVDLLHMTIVMVLLVAGIIGWYLFDTTYCYPSAGETYTCLTVFPDLSEDPWRLLKGK